MVQIDYLIGLMVVLIGLTRFVCDLVFCWFDLVKRYKPFPNAKRIWQLDTCADSLIHFASDYHHNTKRIKEFSPEWKQRGLMQVSAILWLSNNVPTQPWMTISE